MDELKEAVLEIVPFDPTKKKKKKAVIQDPADEAVEKTESLSGNTYTEEIYRNRDSIAQTLSYRAAAYINMGALPEGFRDAEKCIAIDPNFSKGYLRKGDVYLLMKDYSKALELYEEGLKHDPTDKELTYRYQRCLKQINQGVCKFAPAFGSKLPDDLLISILIRQPIKTVIRFKSVCREWQDLISCPTFVRGHHDKVCFAREQQSLCVLLDIKNKRSNEVNSLVLDDAGAVPVIGICEIPEPKFNVLGSINGLVCLSNNAFSAFILWNPATKRHSFVPLPHLRADEFVYNTAGFGYDQTSDSYKIIRILYRLDKGKSALSRADLEIYSTSTHSWTSKEVTDMPCLTGAPSPYGVVVGDYTGWLFTYPDKSCDILMWFDASAETVRFFNVVHHDSDYDHDQQSTVLVGMGENLALLVAERDTGSRYYMEPIITGGYIRKLIMNDEGGERSFNIVEHDFVRAVGDLNTVSIIGRNLEMVGSNFESHNLVLLSHEDEDELQILAALAWEVFSFTLSYYVESLVQPPEDPVEQKKKMEDKKKIEERKRRALKEKEAGNAAYKNYDFTKAIEKYSIAIELDDTDVSILTNRAAAYLQIGKSEECVKDCDEAVKRGRELRVDSKIVAKALTRKGTALVKMAKSSKELEHAIEAFQKALIEHRNRATLKKLDDAYKAKKEAHLDAELAKEEYEKGRYFYNRQEYAEAIKHYTQAIQRNPKDPMAFSYRAASYTKLGALPEGLKDAESCIKLDPTCVQGYARKAAIQLIMKEPYQALETYGKGLKHDASNAELMSGVTRCVEHMDKVSRSYLFVKRCDPWRDIRIGPRV